MNRIEYTVLTVARLNISSLPFMTTAKPKTKEEARFEWILFPIEAQIRQVTWLFQEMKLNKQPKYSEFMQLHCEILKLSAMTENPYINA